MARSAEGKAFPIIKNTFSVCILEWDITGIRAGEISRSEIGGG